MFKLTPPEHFNFSRPTEWPHWKVRFERFRKASKLNQETEDIQVSTLIYTLGSEADKIFQTFAFDPPEDGEDHDDPRDSYETVLEKFDNYFIPRRNIIHERALFHQCIQSPSQTIESYVRMLFEQAEHCSFTNKEENIRDQLVIGLQDKTISRKLQLEPNLTLDKAITVLQTYETVTNQMLSQKDNTNLVNAVTSHRSRGRMRNRYNSNRSHSHSNTSRGGTQSSQQRRVVFWQRVPIAW